MAQLHMSRAQGASGVTDPIPTAFIKKEPEKTRILG